MQLFKKYNFFRETKAMLGFPEKLYHFFFKCYKHDKKKRLLTGHIQIFIKIILHCLRIDVCVTHRLP